MAEKDELLILTCCRPDILPQAQLKIGTSLRGASHFPRSESFSLYAHPHSHKSTFCSVRSKWIKVEERSCQPNSWRNSLGGGHGLKAMIDSEMLARDKSWRNCSWRLSAEKYAEIQSFFSD